MIEGIQQALGRDNSLLSSWTTDPGQTQTLLKNSRHIVNEHQKTWYIVTCSTERVLSGISLHNNALESPTLATNSLP